MHHTLAFNTKLLKVMSELSANAFIKLPDGSDGPGMRITLTSTADLEQYRNAMHQLACSIGMTMLAEKKNFLYVSDVDAATIEQFKAATRQKEKARKPGIADAALDKIVAGKLQMFLSEQAVEASPLMLGLVDPVWCELPKEATMRDGLSTASRLVDADVVATFTRLA